MRPLLPSPEVTPRRDDPGSVNPGPSISRAVRSQRAHSFESSGLLRFHRHCVLTYGRAPISISASRAAPRCPPGDRLDGADDPVPGSRAGEAQKPPGVFCECFAARLSAISRLAEGPTEYRVSPWWPESIVFITLATRARGGAFPSLPDSVRGGGASRAADGEPS